MNKFCLTGLLLLTVLLSSCGNHYEIAGRLSITTLDGKMAYLKTIERDGTWNKLDSAEIVHGKFQMKGPADSVKIVTLCLESTPLLALVLEEGKISVDISNDDFNVKGTALNESFCEFFRKKNQYDSDLEELSRKEARMVMDGRNIDDIQNEISEEETRLLQLRNNYIKSFIQSNYDNLLGPTVFVMMVSSLPYPILTPQIEEILDGAPYSFKMHYLVKEFTEKAKENMQLIEEQRLLQKNMSSKTVK